MSKSFSHLVVTSAFGDYERGEHITDTDQMKKVLESHPHAVVKSSEPYDAEKALKAQEDAEKEATRKAEREAKKVEKDILNPTEPVVLK